MGLDCLGDHKRLVAIERQFLDESLRVLGHLRLITSLSILINYTGKFGFV